ncbi:heterokaryon incompatibility protein-domain-containing protein [Apiospora arundinis]|uniref:Heterokaryon incompatibility protein-domain-containing protein n=1 Tax=Apiospora arundinis TaxID=335852 RepID=A0ABR2I951_9PEZI
MARPYNHEPLESPDSVRLLDLLPSRKWDSPVECRIRQMTFEEARDKYEALSYVWGATAGNRPITCDGGELLVTPNCHDAILHLRRRFHVRTLWIDSICIDQRQTSDSTQERNHQVKKMGLLYQSASRVVIWLGSNPAGPTHLSTKDYRLLKLWKCIGLQKRSFTSLLLWRANYRCIGGSKRPCFQSLVDSSWFLRMWTIQEYAFARKHLILWGKLQMKWHYITYLLDLIHDERQSAQLRLRSIASSLARGAEKKDNASDDLDSFLNCEVFFMLSLRYQESTLDHDKIYGVYAVLRKAGIEIPEPDYSKPVEDVGRELTWAVILSRKRLDLITSEISGDKSPTWVPDYISASRNSSDPDSLVWLQVDTLGRLSPDLSHDHDASLGSKAHIAKGQFPTRLAVQGRRIDIVQSSTVCSTSYTQDTDTLDLHHFHGFIDICLTQIRARTKPNSYLESLEIPQDLKVVIGYLDYTVDMHNGLGLGIVQARANVWANWAFLVTKTGYLGRAYRTCQEGDQLWLLAGAANPVILRQTGSEYRYVAPASFYGMMEGELWPENEEELEIIYLI